MKSLIYSSALLSLFLLTASCKKDGTLPPVKGPTIDSNIKVSSIPPAVLRTIPPGCDSTKLINYVLYNATGDGTLEIAFAGQQNYTFILPAYGSLNVNIKPGRYAVQMYSPGNYPSYNFSLSGEASVTGSGARFANVTVAPCAGPQIASIAR
jgi:hypothetical protein